MSQVKGDDGSSGLTPLQYGVWGDSQKHCGVVGTSDATGVAGISQNAVGVIGVSGKAIPQPSPPVVFPISIGVEGESATGVGVKGLSTNGTGVEGTSTSGVGVSGTSKSDSGVYGRSDKPAPPQTPWSGGSGVFGENQQSGGQGVHGKANVDNGVGVYGEAFGNTESQGVFGVGNGWGVLGWSYANLGVGVEGRCDNSMGVLGVGVYGISGYSDTYMGVWAHGPVAAVEAINTAPSSTIEAYLATAKLAGEFFGDVVVHGSLTQNVALFRIDHPLDPANKYLNHAAVQSPEMKTVYDGVVTLDEKGCSSVELPAWFAALNGDLRYQLTPIAAAAPNLHIAQEVKANRFRIAGGVPGIKVSWQVTGTRQDAWAKAHNVLVEEEKPSQERGYYLHPSLYKQPAEKGIRFARHQELTRGAQARAAILERGKDLSRRRMPVTKEDCLFPQLIRE